MDVNPLLVTVLIWGNYMQEHDYTEMEKIGKYNLTLKP